MSTHDYLVKIAKNWLFAHHKCNIVLSNIRSSSGETPDVTGWNKKRSCFVVECKASRSDFLANLKKPWMQTGLGIGEYRYFMMPWGVMDFSEISSLVSDIPAVGHVIIDCISNYRYADDTWGLLWVDKQERVHVMESASRRWISYQDVKAESSLLLSAIRKPKNRRTA